jgi:hypothetical protein
VFTSTPISPKVLIAVFVDDTLIHVNNLFSRKFKVTDMSLGQEFLNIRITQESHRIIIDQELYVHSLLTKYHSYFGSRNYADVPSLSEYMPRNDTPSSSKQRQFVESFPYPALVDALLFLTAVTRPDIMFAVGVLTHHLKCPTYASFKAACRVLIYLLHHPAIGICYSGSQLNLHAYTDSDWGSDKDTRRSTLGVILVMAGGLVNWISKLQPIVAVSHPWRPNTLPVSSVYRIWCESVYC